MNTIDLRYPSLKRLALSLSLLALAAPLAQAVPIFDTFGPFPNATFGGTGIPNNAVAASRQIVDGDNIITIALAATQRFSNPPLSNDGAGTYFATPGSNFGGVPQGVSTNTEGALWNFNYYIEIEGANGATPQLTDYQFTLFYDFDPAFDTSFGDLGTINVSAAVAGSATPNATLVQDSQNLLFDFLENPVLPVSFVVTPPAGSFDPQALGEYTFAIGVTDGFFPIESVAIDVVIQPVPEPTAALLMTLATTSLLRRRRG